MDPITNHVLLDPQIEFPKFLRHFFTWSEWLESKKEEVADDVLVVMMEPEMKNK